VIFSSSFPAKIKIAIVRKAERKEKPRYASPKNKNLAINQAMNVNMKI
jgi:hypothetical protein